MERFLKAKHWQLFILILGIPMCLQLLSIPLMIMGNEPTFIMKFMPIIMVIFMFGLFGWLYSIAIGLQVKVPEGVKMKVKKFKIFFFIPAIYIIVIFGSMSFGGVFGNGDEFNGGLFAIIVPMHLFSMFGLLYCLYFVAKTLRTVELQKEVSFSDFAGEFFLIWFFPVGVWIVQPRINKLVEVPKDELGNIQR